MPYVTLLKVNDLALTAYFHKNLGTKGLQGAHGFVILIGSHGNDIPAKRLEQAQRFVRRLATTERD